MNENRRFRYTLFCFFLVFLIFNFIWPQLLAQEAAKTKKSLTAEQTLHIYRLSDLAFSPDGTNLAFTVTGPSPENKRNSDIWIYNLKSKQLYQWTTSPKTDRRPRWAPDGSKIAFLSNREGSTQIYSISLSGGEAVRLFQHKTSIISFEWSPDGQKIAFLARKEDSPEMKKKKKEKDDARVVDRDDIPPLLWLYDLKTKKTRPLLKGKWRISQYLWHPAGNRLVIAATDHPHRELFTTKIYTLDLNSPQPTLLFSPSGPFHSLKFSPDGRYLSYIGSREDGPTAHDLFLLSLQSKQLRNLTAETIDRPVEAYGWRSNHSLLALVQTGFTACFYEVDLAGTIKRLPTNSLTPSRSLALSRSGQLAFVGGSATQLPEIWLSLRPGQAERLTSFQADWSNFQLLQPEIIQYTSFDGQKIEAALFKPADYQSNRKYPAVILVHGGPSGAWTDRFNAWAQLLANRGFIVLCPNIRGSTGYGYSFLIANRYDWGGGDFKDVLAGAKFLIQRGLADPERLGIGGWSYGGYMSAWAVTQTDLFRAALSGAPMTDLASEYGTESASINSYDTWYLGNPYENLSLFSQRSPVTHVKKVKTPVLLLCGEQDTTDPLGQCQQFYRGLKRFGVPTEFVVYPREGHGIREWKHRLDLLNRLIAWFEKYLKKTKSP